MFAWTPPNDSVLLSAGGWFLTLVDDATQETSQSDGFNILPADYLNSFTGPYPPPVLGQDHTFYWSPSTNPTVSILIIKAVPYSTVNMTIAGLIYAFYRIIQRSVTDYYCQITFQIPVPSNGPSPPPTLSSSQGFGISLSSTT